MRVGIDASNLRAGGGVTHLRELLAAADPDRDRFDRVTVWGGGALAAALPRREWLEMVSVPMLDGPLPLRVAWQRTKLAAAARGCDVLFVPGGSYAGSFHPVVTMSRNMLPFAPEERRRYGRSATALRLRILERVQGAAMQRADGVIFLNDFARETITRRIGALRGRVATIPHGVSDRLRRPPGPQLPFQAFTGERPFRLSYVSIIDVYKHQWTVAEAVASLVRRGLPVTIDFFGPAYAPALRRLEEALRAAGPAADSIRYRGPVSGEALLRAYHDADAFIFASTCENMPNVLLEAMAAGLPIACAERSPMKEMIGSAAFFDPEDARSVAAAVEGLMRSPELRAQLAENAYRRASEYTWSRCARETFAFLREVAAA